MTVAVVALACVCAVLAAALVVVARNAATERGQLLEQLRVAHNLIAARTEAGAAVLERAQRPAPPATPSEPSTPAVADLTQPKVF